MSTNPNKGGRPATKIDKKALQKLCMMHATNEEIGVFFGCSGKTIQRLRKSKEYRDIFEQGEQQGRLTIRRAQFKAAQSGNTAMLIWLGKVMLGQKDKVSTEHTVPNDGDDVPKFTLKISNEKD